jgi:glutathione synthase/RimK-type ligase-like ATP-grasp enzyme
MKQFNAPKKKQYNILLTCAGGGLSKYNALYLKKNKNKNIKVIGVDIKKNINLKNFDKFYKIPNVMNKNFLKKINEIVIKEKISLIIPTSDEEVIMFSKNKKNFEKKGIGVACEEKNNVKIFTNKYNTYEFLKKNKIDIQSYFFIKNYKELIKKLNMFEEFVVKPIIGRGGRGVYIIKRKVKKNIFLNSGREVTTDLEKFKKNFVKKINSYPLILTPKLKEPVFDVDFLSDKGKLKKIIMRRRLISEEPNSGHIFCKVSNNVKNKFKKICQKLKLHGLYDSDLMKDDTNSFKIIEINTRPSGSVSTTCAAGVNLLEDLINLKTNEKISSKINLKKKKIKLK